MSTCLETNKLGFHSYFGKLLDTFLLWIEYFGNYINHCPCILKAQMLSFKCTHFKINTIKTTIQKNLCKPRIGLVVTGSVLALPKLTSASHQLTYQIKQNYVSDFLLNFILNLPSSYNFSLCISSKAAI